MPGDDAVAELERVVSAHPDADQPKCGERICAAAGADRRAVVVSDDEEIAEWTARSVRALVDPNGGASRTRPRLSLRGGSHRARSEAVGGFL